MQQTCPLPAKICAAKDRPLDAFDSNDFQAPTFACNIYEFAIPQNCRLKRFEAYDKEWLDFIVDSRKGKQPWNGYDIIESGVADDRVIDAVEAYINGYADINSTLGKLFYHKPSWQICILNQEIIDKFLHFKSAERI